MKFLTFALLTFSSASAFVPILDQHHATKADIRTTFLSASKRDTDDRAPLTGERREFLSKLSASFAAGSFMLVSSSFAPVVHAEGTVDYLAVASDIADLVRESITSLFV